MIITGIDPGDPTGVCTIRFDGAFAWWVGDTKFEASKTAQLLDELRELQPDAVAIEKPSGFYPSRDMLTKGGGALAKICEGLLMAAWVGGELCGLARGAGKRVYEVAAPDARRHVGVLIGGRGKARERTVDQQIAEIVPRLIRDWPKRSCPATRDAAVAALYAIQFVRQDAP